VRIGSVVGLGEGANATGDPQISTFNSAVTVWIIPANGNLIIACHTQRLLDGRSHYEDVLVVRVHDLVPESVWSKRYEMINDFESMLGRCGTRIIKFYLHISPEEQLKRFKQRLDDPMRHWKISESERALWPKYIAAYQDAIASTSANRAPWYIIPANHKWFRDLAISQIVADTMDEMGLHLPATRVDLAEIRRKYHAAEMHE